jgi:hypothetical protein
LIEDGETSFMKIMNMGYPESANIHQRHGIPDPVVLETQQVTQRTVTIFSVIWALAVPREGLFNELPTLAVHIHSCLVQCTSSSGLPLRFTLKLAIRKQL